jgi:undecaprenyl-phosphate 4-deoxy-4-formamido-L-arabinose transferase
LGSQLNDWMATWMLQKPKDIYLSSFKVMNRFVVDEVTRYRGPFPYIDGLIYRVTTNIGQIAVEHAARTHGQSGYTLRKMLGLWLNMFLGYSIAPLRTFVFLGLATSLISITLLIAIIVDKLWINPNIPHGIPTLIVSIAFFSGVQLVILGTVGEYVGRIFLEQNGRPQYIVRFRKTAPLGEREDEPRGGGTSGGLPALAEVTRTYDLRRESG